MADHKAFLQAIIDNPDDDAVRLIYADWLDEHGEPARAEFIRLQCQMARLSAEDDRFPELQARTRRLLVEQSPSWEVAVPNPRYRRGFVERVQEWDFKAFLQEARQAFQTHPLRDVGLELRGGSWGTELAAHPELARVRVLRLWNDGSHPFSSEELLKLLRSPHLGPLHALDILVGMDNRIEEEAFIEMVGAGKQPLPASLRGLRYLGLYNSVVTDEGLAALCASPLADSLTSLQLGDNGQLSDEALLALTTSRLWANLEALELSGYQYKTEDFSPRLCASLARSRLRCLDLSGLTEDVDAILLVDLAHALTRSASWGPLETLILSDTELGMEGGRVLARCPHLTGLRCLDLSWTGIADEGLEALVKSRRLGNLTALNLCASGITDDGVGLLAGSDQLGRLTVLDLDSNSIGPAGAAVLAQSSNSRRLRVLSLPNRIADEGLQALAESPYLGHLTSLRLGSIPGIITDAGIRALAQSSRLPCLTYFHHDLKLNEEGQRALLEARHIAWPGLSFNDLKTPELRQLYQERFDRSYQNALGVEEPFFSWINPSGATPWLD